MTKKLHVECDCPAEERAIKREELLRDIEDARFISVEEPI